MSQRAPSISTTLDLPIGYVARARLAPSLIASIPTMGFVAALRPFGDFGIRHLVALAALTLVILVFYGLARRSDRRLPHNEQTPLEDRVRYGFRRNILALKLPSTLLSAAIVVVCLVFDPHSQDMTPSFAFIVVLLHTIYLTAFVTKKSSADARRILEC